ncbi:MAG: hypothetical protein NZ988_04160 [Thaumarchaeota archaeon]|nr:hypothetical protein [Candidatus Calditenuaceae archaeon]MDW8187221.1 hypothetical protein [Nitrososphaerota archaeon]
MTWEQLFDAFYVYAFLSFAIGMVLYVVYEYLRTVKRAEVT